MGFVVVKVKPGDQVKCINDGIYRRQYGSGEDYKLPDSIRAGQVYTVVRITEDYFGSNKITLKVGDKEVTVDPLYMRGTKYENRFENIENPGREIAWVS